MNTSIKGKESDRGGDLKKEGGRNQAKPTSVGALTKSGPDRYPATKGRPFQTHSLQIILFGPITYEPNVNLGSLKIVSLHRLLYVVISGQKSNFNLE